MTKVNGAAVEVEQMSEAQIKENNAANFDTLMEAAQNGDCCLVVGALDKKTGETVNLICAVSRFEEEGKVRVVLTPFAVQIDCTEDPEDRYDPQLQRAEQPKDDETLRGQGVDRTVREEG